MWRVNVLADQGQLLLHEGVGHRGEARGQAGEQVRVGGVTDLRREESEQKNYEQAVARSYTMFVQMISHDTTDRRQQTEHSARTFSPPAKHRSHSLELHHSIKSTFVTVTCVYTVLVRDHVPSIASSISSSFNYDIAQCTLLVTLNSNLTHSPIAPPSDSSPA